MCYHKQIPISIIICGLDGNLDLTISFIEMLKLKSLTFHKGRSPKPMKTEFLAASNIHSLLNHSGIRSPGDSGAHMHTDIGRYIVEEVTVFLGAV